MPVTSCLESFPGYSHPPYFMSVFSPLYVQQFIKPLGMQVVFELTDQNVTGSS